MFLEFAAQAAPNKAGSGEVAIAAVVVSGLVAVLSPWVAGRYQLRAADRAAEAQRTAAFEAWSRDERHQRSRERTHAYAAVVGMVRRRLLDARRLSDPGLCGPLEDAAAYATAQAVEFEEALFVAKLRATPPVREALIRLAAVHAQASLLIGMSDPDVDDLWQNVVSGFANAREELLQAVAVELQSEVPDM